MSAAPRPLTLARVSDALHRIRVDHHLTDDGLPSIHRRGHFLVFVLGGDRDDVLVALGGWAATPPDEWRYALLEWCNDWHINHRWPTAYVDFNDQGELRLRTHMALACQHGTTDDQLADFLWWANAQCDTLFAELTAAFPHSAAWM